METDEKGPLTKTKRLAINVSLILFGALLCWGVVSVVSFFDSVSCEVGNKPILYSDDEAVVMSRYHLAKHDGWAYNTSQTRNVEMIERSRHAPRGWRVEMYYSAKEGDTTRKMATLLVDSCGQLTKLELQDE